MFASRLIVDRNFIVSALDRRLFGSFVEHMGRCLYTGIYEPEHPGADVQGFRQDVMALTRELGITVVRYPGGNFLSGYNWEDGVGPREKRQSRLDLAWFSTETNQIGTNEFMDWCRKVGVEPMFGVNLGTRGPDEARQFLEYCNHPGGTTLSELRRSHGYDQPHDIRLWCLGNEMEGHWQICTKTADEYGRIARETAKLMRRIDPRIQLTVCGASMWDLPSHGTWENAMLEHCFKEVDYLSIHAFFRNPKNSTAEFLSEIELLERYIHRASAIADAVAARKHSHRKIMLSLDEWNVAYKKVVCVESECPPGWPVAPCLIEETYTHEDALVVGGALIAMMNNCDRVKMACMAQLVNVIAPIMTEPGGPAWRQTIFYPFSQAARFAHGEVLRSTIDSATYETEAAGKIPYLCACVVHNEENGNIAVFALNRHLDEDMELRIELCHLGGQRRIEHALELFHTDMKAANSRDKPDTVVPAENTAVRIEGGVLIARLKPGSWNVLVSTLDTP